MDAETVIQGGGLVVSGALVAKVGDWFMAWLRSRSQKTEIAPDPLNVKNEKMPVYVTVGEFNTRLGKVEQDTKDLRTDIQSSNATVIQKLDEIDARSEERSIKTHQRLDPLIQQLGRLSGKMEYIEKAAVAATIGGKK